MICDLHKYHGCLSELSAINSSSSKYVIYKVSWLPEWTENDVQNFVVLHLQHYFLIY